MGKIRILFTTLLLLILSSSFTNFNQITQRTNNELTNLDPETVSWLTRVSLAGGTVHDSIISAVDDYIKEIKGLKYQTVSIRNRLLRENWFTGNFQAAFVPLFINSDGSSNPLGFSNDINHNYPAAGYSDTGQSRGLQGNGINRYLETGFNPALISEMDKDSASFMIYNMSGVPDSGRMGCREGTGRFYFYPKYINDTTYFSINSDTESKLNLASPKGYLLFQRISEDYLNVYLDGSLINSFLNQSTSKPNTDIIIGAYRVDGNVNNPMSQRIGGYSVGKGFSPAQEQVHYTAVQRLMSRLENPSFWGYQPDFKSKLFTFTGRNMVVNYESTQNGSIRFGFRDSTGNPVQNFSLNECIPLSSNSFAHTVSWNSGNDLTALVNKPVFLDVKMDNSDLYSIQFQNQVTNTDSSHIGLKIGTYKQFFADTLFFANNISAVRKMNIPVKNPAPILSPTEPWEGDLLITNYSNIDYSMSLFEERMVYKMWLRVKNSVGNFPAYYESLDGINWMRPNLETFKYNGNMDNNILSDAPYPGGHYTVVDDSLYNHSDSTRRYKSVYNYHTTVLDSRLYISFSYDGLIWVPYSGNPVRDIGEDLSTSGWNPVLGKYLGYFRDTIGVRNVGRYLSDDWINWTYTATVLKPDPFDPPVTKFYNMEVLFKDSVYWGFAGHFQLNPAGDENPVNPTRTDNTVFTELLFSRDGINFVRCGNRQPFINYGSLGSWDDQMVYTIGVPVRVGNEFYIYYNGFNFKHISNAPPPFGGGIKKSQIGLAKIGVDRFVSLSSN